MPTLSIPLTPETLYSTGNVILRAFVEMLLKDSQGNWHQETFRVDSGSPITTFSAYHAQKLGLPFPANPAMGVTHEPTGLEVRSGYLRCQIVGLSQTEFDFPCFFLGDPTVPVGITPAPTMPRSLLGLSGVIDKVKWKFDGDPVPPNAAYGVVTFEER